MDPEHQPLREYRNLQPKEPAAHVAPSEQTGQVPAKDVLSSRMLRTTL
jgi:hypothetical protein